jgi:rRNA maturation RNase YbeY
MGCAIEIAGDLPRSAGLTKKELKCAASFFAAKSSARIAVPFREVTVVLQDDEASDAAHRAVMGVEGATDVITQGFDAMPPEPAGVYGELYVNCERAAAAAPSRRGWSVRKELLLYVAHGMDHLSGAEDLTGPDRARMRSRELRWVREYENR